ncbi:MAG: alpha/beta fold hydrolase [Anaerolineae bacterium]
MRLNRFFVFSLLIAGTLAACFSGTSVTPDALPELTAAPSLPPPPLSDDGGGLLPEAAPVIPSGQPIVPLSIEMLRQRTYDSDFVIEQTLDNGSNYYRYIVSYRSDGLKIYALLTIPWDTKPPTGYPVVIFNHGYIPPDQYRTTERYVAYVDAFARSGYIVVRPDYRGHGSSEGEASSAYGDPGYTIDVLNATAAARRYPDADPNRVGMWGHSMGGYITLRAMVARQNIKAGVIWAGVVASYADLFESWFSRGNAVGTPIRQGWRSDLVEQFGTPDDNPAFWDSLSANAYLSQLSGPVQIHHGTGDTTVPFEYSTTLDQQIRAAGGVDELFLYPNDDHNIATNRDAALALSVVFFNRYVKNG